MLRPAVPYCSSYTQRARALPWRLQRVLRCVLVLSSSLQLLVFGVMGWSDSSAMPAKAAFECTYETACRDRDGQVQQPGQEQDVEVAERVGPDRVGLAEQLGQAERERQGADLENQDREAHERWKCDAQPLRNDDEAGSVGP